MDKTRNYKLNNNRRVTLADVAKMANVSKQTVSRVVNNSPNVTLETRTLVQRCIETLGFRPSALARQLYSGRSYTLGIVGNTVKGYLAAAEAYIGLLSITDQMGYALLNKLATDFTLPSVSRLMEQLIERQVDGVIWAGPDYGDSHSWMDHYPFDSLPMPIVALNTKPRAGIDVVCYDNLDGGRQATQHLIDSGRKHIAHISGPLDRWVANQRYLGWKAALEAAGMQHCFTYHVEGDWETASGAPSLRALRQRFPQIDAVFVSSDRMALGVLLEAQQQGIAVPQGLAVVGIDDDPQSAHFIPPLTSMAQDSPAMAQAAMRLLVRRICDQRGESYPPGCDEIETSVFRHRLIVRESSGGR